MKQLSNRRSHVLVLAAVFVTGVLVGWLASTPSESLSDRDGSVQVSEPSIPQEAHGSSPFNIMPRQHSAVGSDILTPVSLSTAKVALSQQLRVHNPARTNLVVLSDHIEHASIDPGTGHADRERLLTQLEQQPALVEDLLNRDWPSREEFMNMLASLGTGTSNALRDAVRAIALDMTYSSELATREKGVIALSLADGLESVDGRRRLLDLGWGETAPSVQLAVVESMEITLVPPAERQEIVSLLSDISRSSTDAEVRAATMYQLINWQDDPQLLSYVANNILGDRDPTVRTAGINALGMMPLSEDHRTRLFWMVENTEEDLMVRTSAADVLARSSLNDHQYNVVHTLLSQVQME